MTLDRFLSASLAGSSVSLNFKNWHHRIYRDRGCQQLRTKTTKGHLPKEAGLPQSLQSWRETFAPQKQRCGAESTAAAAALAPGIPANGAAAPMSKEGVSEQPSGSRDPGLGPGPPTGTPIHTLTLALTPSCAPGTRGMASYRDETYVMIDFSSG